MPSREFYSFFSLFATRATVLPPWPTLARALSLSRQGENRDPRLPCAPRLIVGLTYLVLSWAGFSLARALFDPAPSSSASAGATSPPPAPLPPPVIEELVISASREFYDNAESGNLHTEEMKLALDWYAPPPSPSPPSSSFLFPRSSRGFWPR